MSKLAANILGTLLTIAFCIVGVSFAHMLFHRARFSEWQVGAFFVPFLVLLPVHEALHAVGLRIFARVSWRHIKFGVMWRALMPFCHCTVPTSVHAYRRMALLPLWVTGSVSVISG